MRRKGIKNNKSSGDFPSYVLKTDFKKWILFCGILRLERKDIKCNDDEIEKKIEKNNKN